jgi:L-iditol 2-dehydrogenase
MKSLYLTAPRTLELREESIPTPRENEILVKVAYCGICTLEQRLFEGERTIHYPLVPGHEASGTVVTVGSKVMTRVKRGDAVVLDLVNRCHACAACHSGNSNLCENRYHKGQRILGAFTQYLVVRPEQVLVIPHTLPLEEAALTEPLACCIRSIAKTNIGLGDTLLIAGAGTMGLLHAKVALAMGVRVIMSDIDHDRLRVAKQIGVDFVVNALDEKAFSDSVLAITGGALVDGCIITTEAVSAVATSIPVLAPGGTLTIYTSYGNNPELPTDMNTIHRNEFTITGSEGREQSDFFTAMRALANRKVVVDDLVSQIYAMNQAQEAIEHARSGKAYRILLRMEE